MLVNLSLDVECFKKGLLEINIYYFENYLFSSWAQTLIGMFSIFMFSFSEFFFIFSMLILHRMSRWQIFFPFYILIISLTFHSIIIPLTLLSDVQKHFNFMKCHLLTASLIFWATGILFGKSLPMSKLFCVFLTFWSRRFSVVILNKIHSNWM